MSSSSLRQIVRQVTSILLSYLKRPATTTTTTTTRERERGGGVSNSGNQKQVKIGNLKSHSPMPFIIFFPQLTHYFHYSCLNVSCGVSERVNEGGREEGVWLFQQFFLSQLITLLFPPYTYSSVANLDQSHLSCIIKNPHFTYFTYVCSLLV